MDILRSFISGALLHFPKISGQMSHSYSYDPLYRLSSATGTYKGTDNKAASYTLSMGYDNMHRITSKKQHLSTMFVISTTARKKLLRRARISTTDTSTLTMPTESLFLDTWMPLR